MANPISLENLAARLSEIDDMVEDLATEREAISNLIRVLRKGQPVREPRVVPEKAPAQPPSRPAENPPGDGEELPAPKEAIREILAGQPGWYTRRALVDLLENRVASSAENVRNVLYTQLRRDETAGRVWEAEDGKLYPGDHPLAVAAREATAGEEAPAPDSADAGDNPNEGR